MQRHPSRCLDRSGCAVVDCHWGVTCEDATKQATPGKQQLGHLGQAWGYKLAPHSPDPGVPGRRGLCPPPLLPAWGGCCNGGAQGRP